MGCGVFLKTVRRAQCFLSCFPRRPHALPSRRLELILRRLGGIEGDGLPLRDEAVHGCADEVGHRHAVAPMTTAFL